MIDLKTNKTYCPFLFRGANLSAPRSEIVPCCRYQKKAGDPYPNTFEDGYDAFWKDIRKKAINGEKIDGCWRCYQEEYSGTSSMRTRSLAPRHDEDIEVPYRSQQEIDYTDTKLEFLEIQTGRYCNLKCRSCSPHLSTTWDEDLDKSDEVRENFFGEDTSIYSRLKSFPKTNTEIANISYEIVKDLINVKVTGGEPFLNDQFQVFLSNLVKWDLAKNITIEVFTNCSFFPKEAFRKQLLNFKKVRINLSLDGINEQAEFLRKGSDWPKVIEAADNWKKYASENPKIYLAISHTLTIFNILYFKKFCDWARSFFEEEILKNKFNLTPTVAQMPGYLSIYNFDKKVKRKLIKILTEQHATGISNNDDYSKIVLNRIIPALKKDDFKNYNKEFLDKAKLFDDVRDENWRGIFPELAEVLEELNE